MTTQPRVDVTPYAPPKMTARSAVRATAKRKPRKAPPPGPVALREGSAAALARKPAPPAPPRRTLREHSEVAWLTIARLPISGLAVALVVLGLAELVVVWLSLDVLAEMASTGALVALASGMVSHQIASEMGL